MEHQALPGKHSNTNKNYLRLHFSGFIFRPSASPVLNQPGEKDLAMVRAICRLALTSGWAGG